MPLSSPEEDFGLKDVEICTEDGRPYALAKEKADKVIVRICKKKVFTQQFFL